MAHTESITRGNIPSGAHRSYRDSRSGIVPQHIQEASFFWDPDFIAEFTDDGKSWIEWLFDIRPAIGTAEFEAIEGSRFPFTTMLVKGINWDECRERIESKQEEEISEASREQILILLDLIQSAHHLDRDLKHVRLARRPQG